MAKLVSNVGKRNIRTMLPITNPKGLVALGQSVHDALTGNLNFTVPLPPLVDVQTAVDNCVAAITAAGSTTNRGGALARQQLILTATALRNILSAEASYVMNTAGQAAKTGLEYNTLMTTSGFALKSKLSKIDKLQVVRGLKQVSSKKHPFGEGWVKFKKPGALIKGSVCKSYAITVGTVKFTITNTIFQVAGPAGQHEITVTPLSARGAGSARTILVIKS